MIAKAVEADYPAEAEQLREIDQSIEAVSSAFSALSRELRRENGLGAHLVAQLADSDAKIVDEIAPGGPQAVDELLGSFASATDRVGRIAWIRERFKLEDESGAAAA